MNLYHFRNLCYIFRTLKIRVLQQSKTASELAHWLDSYKKGDKTEDALSIVERVWHGSLPDHPGHAAGKRQGMGWSGVLSVQV